MESFTNNLVADQSALIDLLKNPLTIYRNGESVWGTDTYLKAIADVNASIRRIKKQDNSVLISSDLSDEMMEMIVESLKANGKDLEKIDRILVFFRVSGVTALIEALAKNTTVHTLAIADGAISEQDIIVLAETMMKNRTIRTMDIGRDNLRVESTKALAKSLAKNTSIISLHIDVSRKMGEDGAAELAKALVTNVTLRTGKVFFSRYRKFLIGDVDKYDTESGSDEDEDM